MIMRFPPSILEEIRARLPVTAVVGRRVRLTKAGREWKGLSPFNAEKTPSFYVNDHKGFFHCFSSGKHGDIFTFLMETEGVSFPEAVERLAADAGVTLPKVSEEAQADEERRRGLHEIMDMAAQFFAANLAKKEGAQASRYLDGRGLGREARTRFRLGYALPDRFALRDHLAAQGVGAEAMIEAGLLVNREDVTVPHDRFRDRIMFPITDVRGRVIAFGGRAMSADAPAKYLNSSETPLFHKGHVLYNHQAARKAAHDKGTVVVVEGYVDVIAMTMAGFPHTVAPLGTALTEDQLTLIWRMAPEPILCFDGDGAGRRAAYRAIDVALPHLVAGQSLRFALLPEGQDPDDLARSGGAPAIAQVLDKAQPLVDLLWMREVETASLDTPERRAALEKRLFGLLNGIRDEDLRRHYRAEIGERLRQLLPQTGGRRDGYAGGGRGPGFRQAGAPAYGGQTFGKNSRGGRDARPRAGKVPLQISPSLARNSLFAATSTGAPREALIVLTLLAHPELMHRYGEIVTSLDFSNADALRLRACLIDREALATDGPDLAGALPQDVVLAAERLRAVVRHGDVWAFDRDAELTAVEEMLRQALTLHRRAFTLHSELKAAERALAADESEANLAWLTEVRTELTSLDGAEADREAANKVSTSRNRP
ncbi:DNA primase [Chelatococcus asaccharovorans]|nr:DNA primase [Chelatococcus asaccharovorans]CAH1682491.1 DNA primase [Chelatococcus asaccharovorans]